MLQSPGPQWVNVRRKEQQRVTVMQFPGPVHCSRELGMKKPEWSGAEKEVGGGKV